MEAIHPLRAYRESQNPPVSKSELARALSVTWNTVHRWETGDRKPNRDLLPVIERKLGVASADILAFERRKAEAAA